MYDLEEQEQIDALKDWWKRNGRTAIIAVVVFLLAFAGVQAWRAYQRDQAAQAAALFDQVERAVKAKDAKQAVAGAQSLRERFPSSAYAARGGLMAARAAFDGGDGAGAKSQLEWVVANAREPEVKAVARLRLAGLLGDEKKYPEALSLIDQVTEAGFAPLAQNVKGDVLMAQGRRAEARAAFKAALEGSDGRMRQVVQTKLDALGDAK